MGLVIIVVIAYLPIIYRINKRLNYLENEVERLNKRMTKTIDK
jgi:hypothetical protein